MFILGTSDTGGRGKVVGKASAVGRRAEKVAAVSIGDAADGLINVCVSPSQEFRGFVFADRVRDESEF